VAETRGITCDGYGVGAGWQNPTPYPYPHHPHGKTCGLPVPMHNPTYEDEITVCKPPLENTGVSH